MVSSRTALIVQLAWVCAGMIGGGLWIMLAGGASAIAAASMKRFRVSSCRSISPLAILHHLVEGLMRDPPSP